MYNQPLSFEDVVFSFFELPGWQFVIDLAQPSQVSASWMELLQLLESPHMSGKPVLIALNHGDAATRMTEEAARAGLRLDDLERWGDGESSRAGGEEDTELPPRVTSCVVSAKTGEGVDHVISWLEMHVAQEDAEKRT